jgi:hypothetical protein
MPGAIFFLIFEWAKTLVENLFIISLLYLPKINAKHCIEE